MATADFHVQFDATNSRRYHRSVARFLAMTIMLGVAVISAPLAAFQWTGGNVASSKVDADGFTAAGILDDSDIALFALVPILAIGAVALAIVLVVVPSLLRKNFDAQRCMITATQIMCESGWLNCTTQNVPLDRIQDLSVKQGFLQRRFGIHTIEIQTAGSPSPFPEAVLYAPKDAQRVRDEIMKRRDALLFGGAGGTTSRNQNASSDDDRSIEATVASTALSDEGAGASDQEAVVAALAELNRTMLRIETLLTKAAKQ